MNFYDQLQLETEKERQYLLSSPIISACMQGDIDLQDYVAFLTQAYHHVRHTVPLLMATGARLPADKEWLRNAVAEYIEEELGHQEWILNDIQACGVDKEDIRFSRPAIATELMIAYAYDVINRVNPIGFFGMVHVLEGTSITTADRAAEAIKNSLKLPGNAFTYLRSHGALDVKHVAFFKDLMNKITEPSEQALIVHSARVFYQLYANIFRSLTHDQALAA